jgi:hypothetical protein
MASPHGWFRLCLQFVADSSGVRWFRGLEVYFDVSRRTGVWWQSYTPAVVCLASHPRVY